MVGGESSIYVIVVYDVGIKRVAKVLKTARKYLTWIQNSVLEGELSQANFKLLKLELGKVIDKKDDSVIFYVFRTRTYSERQIMGVEKGTENNIL